MTLSVSFDNVPMTQKKNLIGRLTEFFVAFHKKIPRQSKIPGSTKERRIGGIGLT